MKRLFIAMLLSGSMFALVGCNDTINNEGIIAQEGSTVNVTIQQEERIETDTQIPRQVEENEYIQKAIDEEKAILLSHNNMATLRCEQPHAKAGKQYEILDVVFNKNNLRYVFIDDFGQIAEINKINFESLDMIYTIPEEPEVIEKIAQEEPETIEEPVQEETELIEEPEYIEEPEVEIQEEQEEQEEDLTALTEWGVHSEEYAPDGYRFIAEYNGYHHSTTHCNHINDGRQTKIIPKDQAYDTRKTCKHC